MLCKPDWPVTDYILGNPPFIGSKLIDKNQRVAFDGVMSVVPKSGVLDFVSAWYVKAAQLIKANAQVRCALVSTSSITQGEQVGILWSWMLAQGIHIQFAHRTFVWQSAAKGKAAVHCVIIGFGTDNTLKKTIFDYEEGKGLPIPISANNINAYLVDAENVFLENRTKPICQVPIIGIGNKPIDGGNYLFTEAEKVAFIKQEPLAEKYFRVWLGADEFINNYQRHCLWLGDVSPSDLRKMPNSMKRIEAVKQLRLASSSAPTQKLAATPTRFHVENFPKSNYLLVPRVSSEKRLYLPVGFIKADVLTSDSAIISQKANLFDFGIMTSIMHNAWMRAVCGRLESRYRYSVGIVYNNFPWPLNPTDKQKQTIEAAAQAVLDARATHPECSLADLYDPLTMPVNLLKAHQQLDKAVDAAYGKTKFANEAERVAFLFELYQQYTAPS
jgi:hypothetical protein